MRKDDIENFPLGKEQGKHVLKMMKNNTPLMLWPTLCHCLHSFSYVLILFMALILSITHSHNDRTYFIQNRKFSLLLQYDIPNFLTSYCVFVLVLSSGFWEYNSYKCCLAWEKWCFILDLETKFQKAIVLLEWFLHVYWYIASSSVYILSNFN
jgi:hypothetical protein